VLLAACGSPSPAATPTIQVFAAASLTDAFKAEAAAFHGARVQLNFGGSSTLAAQIAQGAPAEVFASADQASMQRVVGAGQAAAHAVFATNRLQLVVGPGNPKGIHSLADLARPGLVVVLCAPAVPCGAYAAQALGKAGVTVHPASQEQDVKAVVTKVALGEADAGIVYQTDVRAAGRAVAGVEIPAGENVIAEYPIAVLRGAGPEATAFVDFVRSSEGQRILAGFGFGPA